MTTLSASNLVKRYGATRALTGLTMTIESGSVVGIAGPNGAGKSTLMRIISGEEKPDGGQVSLSRDGVALTEMNVAVVHQEPHVWPNLTVSQNLAVGNEVRSRGHVGPAPEALETLALLGIEAYADFELGDLSLAVQQRVEIARALIRRADVFLFDEPNSALTDEESRSLFELMAKLAESGKIVLLVTHRLNDFVNACTKVLVVRDGRVVAELGTKEPLTEGAIAAELTIGLASHVSAPVASASKGGAGGMPAHPLLSLKGYSDRKGAFRDVVLDVHPGRILVVVGVEGSGARELVQCIGGYRSTDTGPHDGRRPSVAYVAASRRHTVFHNMSVGENLVIRLAEDQLTSPRPWLSAARIRTMGLACLKRYVVKAGSLADPIGSLSGGNQQKVVLGAALETEADILVIEEPTRGVDLASKQDIYGVLRAYCDAGRSIILFCTEVPEMYGMADEIVVLSRGELVGRIAIDAIPDMTALAHQLAEFEAAVRDGR